MSFTWEFTGELAKRFKTCEYNVVLHSNDFTIDDCTFFLECTPNGFKDTKNNFSEGECVIWLAIRDTLPKGIGSVNVTLICKCDDIGWNDSTTHNKLGYDYLLPGCSWSTGINSAIDRNKFLNLSKWNFQCQIIIHKKNPKSVNDNSLLSILSLLSNTNNNNNDNNNNNNDKIVNKSFTWNFNEQLSKRFKTCEFNSVIHSNDFIIDGCTFYIECTPNGFTDTKNNFGQGNCVIWLALRDSLPKGIGSLDITFDCQCKDINWNDTKRYSKLGYDFGCSWSVGLDHPIETNKFENLSNWNFECDITINKKNGKSEISNLLTLLSMVKDIDDDKKDDDDDDDDDVKEYQVKDDAGLNIVDGTGTKSKLNINYNMDMNVNELKQQIANNICCDVNNIKLLTKDFREIKYNKLNHNNITQLSELIIVTNDNEKETINYMINNNKWKNKKFVKKAKNLLKLCDMEGKKGINKLLKENNLKKEWSNIFDKMNYTDVLKIISNVNVMNDIHEILTKENIREKYDISQDDINAVAGRFQYKQMEIVLKELRDAFYENMNLAITNGLPIILDNDSSQIFKLFTPNKNKSFFGILLLIDSDELKLRGIKCKNFDNLKRGQAILFPGFQHDKIINWRNEKLPRGKNVNPMINYGTGHQQLCDLANLPNDFCAGFAIKDGQLLFRSGTCNYSKRNNRKIKGFTDGERTLAEQMRKSLEIALERTSARQFYTKSDHTNQ